MGPIVVTNQIFNKQQNKAKQNRIPTDTQNIYTCIHIKGNIKSIYIFIYIYMVQAGMGSLIQNMYAETHQLQYNLRAHWLRYLPSTEMLNR